MMQLSYWAKQHKWQARMLLVLLHGLLISLAFTLGAGLQTMELIIPAAAIYIFVFVFLLACCLYPSKGEHYKKTYRSRKTYEGIAAIAGLLLVTSFFNHQDVANSPFHTGGGALASAIERPVVKPPAKSLAKTFIQKLKATVALRYLQWRAKMKSGAPAEKVVQIILFVLLAMVLLSLVLALSCNLACAGSDALAALVGIFGTALVIFLLIKAIKWLNKKYNPSPAPQHQKPSVTKAL